MRPYSLRVLNKNVVKRWFFKIFFSCSQTGKQTFSFFTEQNKPTISNTWGISAFSNEHTVIVIMHSSDESWCQMIWYDTSKLLKEILLKTLQRPSHIQASSSNVYLTDSCGCLCRAVWMRSRGWGWRPWVSSTPPSSSPPCSCLPSWSKTWAVNGPLSWAWPATSPTLSETSSPDGNQPSGFHWLLYLCIFNRHCWTPAGLVKSCIFVIWVNWPPGP